MENETVDQSNSSGVRGLDDIRRDHEETGGRGRPPAPSTGDPARDRKREAQRRAYAERKGRPYVAPAPSTVSAREPDRELFTADTCRGLVGLPFSIAAAYSKSKAWNLEESEEQVLSGPCADTLNAWFPQASPKYAALTAFSLALCSIAGKKYLIFKEEVRNRVETEPKS